MLFSMVPVIGGAAVWAACIAWLYLGQDRVLAATLLGVWGFIAATIADYGIKPYILHGQSNLHPLLALLSVLGGVETLGLIGIFVGPMVVAFLQALLNILRTELTRWKSGRWGRGKPGANGPTARPQIED